MKLLYLANVRLPTEKAHGIQIMKTCEALGQAGAEVELVVPTRRNDIADDPFAYYGVQKTFALKMVRTLDFIRFGPLGFLVSALCFSERAHFSKSFWRADVIYSRDAFVLAQYILLRRRLVFEAHARPAGVSRFVARRAYRVVVISNALKDAYVAAGVFIERILVAPDAVDERFFDGVPSRAAARAALGIAAQERTVVYTGHLYERKGAHLLAEAAATLPDAQFYFVGGTAADVASFRDRWGSKKNVHIVGHVTQAHVAQYLRAADVLVIPNSAKDADAKHFTSPMKLFEYMASGTPIVAACVPAIREVLGDNEATFFTPDDAHSLGKAIEKALSDDAAAQKKAAQAKQQATEYTWAKRAERISHFLT